MWIKDIRNYEIDVYQGDNLIYSGNVDDASEEVKQMETITMKIEHKRLKIDVK